MKGDDLIPVSDVQAKRTREVIADKLLGCAVVQRMEFDCPIAENEQFLMVALMTAAKRTACRRQQGRFVLEMIGKQCAKPPYQELEFSRFAVREPIAAANNNLVLCVDRIVSDS